MFSFWLLDYNEVRAYSRKYVSVPSIVVLATMCGSACGPPERVERPVFFIDDVARAEAEYDRARFAAHRKDGLMAAPITMGGDTRRSITPPLPSRLTFDISVPPDPILQFSIGVNLLGDYDFWPPVEFRLAVDQEGDPQTLFVESVDRTRPNQWLDQSIDLKQWSGSEVRLTLETRLRRGGDRVPWTARRILPVWGNPVLASKLRGDERPNLILISVDALRPDHLGTYGYERDTSPHIDAFSNDGVVFENAVATSSWTLPTHMSMFTGLPPSLHGATKWEKMDTSIQYLPEILADQGYEVNGIASWVYLSQAFGFERGFHTYRVLDQPPAEKVVDLALDLLRRAQGRNQFLFIHLFDPHWPYLPPREFIERFGPRPNDISDLLDVVARREPPENPGQVQEAVNLYDGVIAYLDREIGRLFRGLEDLDLYDDTLVILTADHGEAFHEHGHWEHSYTLYEEVVRIPLIVKWPGSQRRDRHPGIVSQVDIFPTLLNAAAIGAPPMEGVDLADLLDEPDTERNVLIETTWRSPEATRMLAAYRSDSQKYIVSLVGPPEVRLNELEVEREELYLLTNDPNERDDLSSNRSEALAAFRSKLDAYLQYAGTLHFNRQGERVVLDEATKEKLRSLGYVVQ